MDLTANLTYLPATTFKHKPHCKYCFQTTYLNPVLKYIHADNAKKMLWYNKEAACSLDGHLQAQYVSGGTARSFASTNLCSWKQWWQKNMIIYAFWQRKGHHIRTQQDLAQIAKQHRWSLNYLIHYALPDILWIQ